MKFTISLFSLILFSQMANAGEFITLNLDVKSDLIVNVGAQYKAQRDVFFCKSITTSDGEIRTVPKLKQMVIGESSTVGKYKVEVRQALNDTCDYELAGLSVTVSNQSLSFRQSFGVRSRETAPVGTQRVLIGPSAKYNHYVSNAYDITVGPSEEASISFEVVDFDPFPSSK